METTNYNDLESKAAQSFINVVDAVNKDVRKAHVEGLSALINLCDNGKMTFRHPIFIDDCYVASVAKTDNGIEITTTPHYDATNDPDNETATRGIEHFKTKHIAKVFNRMAAAIRKYALLKTQEQDDTDENQDESQE